MTIANQIVEALTQTLEDGKIRTDSESLKIFGLDRTKLYTPDPLAIVFPRSTKQVQSIVNLANKLGFSLVPSGGRTGLSAGAVASNGEVVVSFDYMNKILDFNENDRSVCCQAGVVTEALQSFALDRGLYYPVDFASAGSSQIGGNLATNAGGIKVIKYGMSRDWVLGLEVVTGAGETLKINQNLLKNNTGYDFRHLFIGAEGTLGFITEATMKLTRKPENETVIVLGLSDIASTMSVLKAFQSKLDLSAYEFFSHHAMEYVIDHVDISVPFSSKAPFYALLEFEAISDEKLDTAMELFEVCIENAWVIDGVISQNETQAKNLWRLREEISESISSKTPYKNDISVVPSKVPDFLTDIDELVKLHYPDFEIIWFGHIGDGNLHLNILKPELLEREEFFEKCRQVNQWVFEIVKKYKGSVSAEHGVGLTKKDYLKYTRSEQEISLMRGVKRVFDPNGVMNPGKIFDSE